MIIPFGYTMENGRIEINRQQTETLRGIFAEYIQGTSLKAKAEELSEDKIEYAPGKYTWNKNRVQRILTDQRYLERINIRQSLMSQLFRKCSGLWQKGIPRKAVTVRKCFHPL